MPGALSGSRVETERGHGNGLVGVCRAYCCLVVSDFTYTYLTLALDPIGIRIIVTAETPALTLRNSFGQFRCLNVLGEI